MGLGCSDLQRWGGEGRTGPKGPSPPRAERRQPAPHLDHSSPPRPPPSARSFSLEGTRPMMHLPHPKQVPGPAWGSIRELGGGSQAGCFSNLSPTSQAEWLHHSWFSDQEQAPGPISQACSLGHFSQGPSRCWSSHEAPCGQNIPGSDREAELLHGRPLGTPPWAGAGAPGLSPTRRHRTRQLHVQTPRG